MKTLPSLEEPNVSLYENIITVTANIIWPKAFVSIMYSINTLHKQNKTWIHITQSYMYKRNTVKIIKTYI